MAITVTTLGVKLPRFIVINLQHPHMHRATQHWKSNLMHFDHSESPNQRPIHPLTIVGHRLLNFVFWDFWLGPYKPQEQHIPSISQPSWASNLGRCSNHLQADIEPDESSPCCPVFSAARRGQTDLDMSCGLWGKFNLNFPEVDKQAFALKQNGAAFTSWEHSQGGSKLIDLPKIILWPPTNVNNWAFRNEILFVKRSCASILSTSHQLSQPSVNC